MSSTRFDGPGIATVAPRDRLVLVCLLTPLLVAALAILLGPRNGLLKLNAPPTDRPWADLGLSGLFVAPDGTWNITRQQYADRQQRYELSPEGSLTTYTGGMYRGDDVSGGTRLRPYITPAGNTATINPAPPYYAWLRSLRPGGNGDKDFRNELPKELPSSEPVPARRLAPRVEGLPHRIGTDSEYLEKESYVQIKFSNFQSSREARVLPGHWFYDVFDDMAAIDSTIWLTTDKQRMLHRLRLIEDDPDHPLVAVERSAMLPFDPTSHNCRIGLDPLRQELFILLSNGMRYWFDPVTLEPHDSEQLPGVWEREYASWDIRPGKYSQYIGAPLTEAQYDRIMRAAMLVFLASLLGLALLWRPQWKSTSAATTADSSSNADSPPT